VALALPRAALRLFGDPSAPAGLGGPADHPAESSAAADVSARWDAPLLDAAAPDPQVMARMLEDGDREDLAWLCRQLPADALAAWVERHGARRLSRRSLSFWAVMLDRPDLLPERLPELERRRELWPL
jgi:hypothetical protein